MDGLSVRINWGERRLHSELIRSGGRGFSVGTAPGVDFPTGDVAGADRFMLVPEGEARTVRFARGVSGALWRGDVQLTLGEAVERGEALPDGGAYAVTLGARDAMMLELGALQIEALPAAAPKAVRADPLAAIDLRMLNILAAVFALAFAFVLSAVTADEGAYRDDDSVEQTHVLAKFVLAPPAPTPTPAALAARQPDRAPSKAGAAPRKPHPDRAAKAQGNDPRALVAQVGHLMDGLLPGHGSASDPLGLAISGLKSTGIASNGIEGMALKGDPSGGGGGQLIGLGGINWPGHGKGPGLGGDAVGPICRHCKNDIPPQVEGTEVKVVGMDKDLIRQVIHSHRDQVRFCYELGLTSNPALAGKTSVRFVIDGSGDVKGATVVDSTVKNQDLETCIAGRVGSWRFPKPPGGGVVSVTYPFVFQRAGR